MRRLAVAMGVLVASLAAIAAAAGEVSVTSDPPGAEVWVAPADQPGLYRKGFTPCTLTLAPAGNPYRLVIRHPGHFPVFRTLGDEPRVSVRLLSRDDPASWQLVPPLPGGGGEPTHEGVPEFIFSQSEWTPDAARQLMWGNAWGSAVEEMGLAKRDEEREVSDLWVLPLHGAPVRIWRFLSDPREQSGYEIDAASSPDGRWIVHSAPAGGREHLELYCLTTGQHRSIAAESAATLFCPVFSPDGRRVACLRITEAAKQATEQADDGPEEPPAEIQVMQWNGLDRRTLVKDAYGHLEPAFSPDGSQLAYLTADRQIAVLPVTGGKPRVILKSPPWRAAASPVWSPDGQALAAEFDREDEDSGPGRRGRSETQRVLWARLDGTASGAFPSVSLHGWHDAASLDVYAPGYCAAADTSYQRLLWVGLDGRQRTVLRAPATLCHHSSTSADGKQAAALECGLDGTQHVVLAVANEPLRRFAAPELVNATALGWLDAGRLWVAVAATADGPPAYELELATGALKPLTAVPKPPPEDPLGPPGPPLPPGARGEGTPGPILPGGEWFELAPTIPSGGEAP